MAKIALVDLNTRRRAGMVSSGLDLGVHVEPFDSFEELVPFLPSMAGVVIYDCGNLPFQECQDSLEESRTIRPIVAFGNPRALDRAVEATRCGFADYLAEDMGERAMLQRALQSFRLMDTKLEARKVQAAAKKLIGSLSKRESEVLDGVLSGDSNKNIAQKLNISPRTVEVHRANMVRKLDATGTAGVVSVAMKAGRIPSSQLNY